MYIKIKGHMIVLIILGLIYNDGNILGNVDHKMHVAR
jgi:hypothetical protein